MDRERLATRLKLKEGLRLKAYKDTMGFWTICYGHLLGPAPVPPSADCDQCEKWLSKDIDEGLAIASSYPWYAAINSPYQNVVAELGFNLGGKLHKFVSFLHYMQMGRYQAASQELKNSLAYKEEPHRFDELITALTTGEYPV